MAVSVDRLSSTTSTKEGSRIQSMDPPLLLSCQSGFREGSGFSSEDQSIFKGHQEVSGRRKDESLAELA